MLYEVITGMGGQRFFHLAQHRVAQQHGRNPVTVGKIKAQHGQVVHFLHRMGRQNDDVITAVATALDRLEIVGLGRVNAAEPGTA